MWRLAILLVMMAGCDFVFRIDEYTPNPNADASIDAFVSDGIEVVGVTEGHDDGATNTLAMSFTVPAIVDGFMIVSVEMSGGSPGPTVAAIIWSGVPLTLLDQITGVPGHDSTRTEQWSLVAPPAASGNVTVSLTSNSDTVRASVMLFAGVNQTSPVRAVAHDSGNAATGAVVVVSAAGDLVESTVGQGGGIASTDTGMLIYIDTGNGGNTLDNAAGSVSPGSAPSIDMAWSFIDSDLWQEIAASLEPSSH